MEKMNSPESLNRHHDSGASIASRLSGAVVASEAVTEPVPLASSRLSTCIEETLKLWVAR